MKLLTCAVLSVGVLGACVDAADDETSSDSQASTGEQGMHGAAEPHMQFARDAQPTGGGTTTSPLMTLHGGNVIPASKTMAIFWGSSWTTPSFAGDKITGLDTFFSGFGN